MDSQIPVSQPRSGRCCVRTGRQSGWIPLHDAPTRGRSTPAAHRVSTRHPRKPETVSRCGSETSRNGWERTHAASSPASSLPGPGPAASTPSRIETPARVVSRVLVDVDRIRGRFERQLTRRSLSARRRRRTSRPRRLQTWWGRGIERPEGRRSPVRPIVATHPPECGAARAFRLVQDRTSRGHGRRARSPGPAWRVRPGARSSGVAGAERQHLEGWRVRPRRRRSWR